MKQQLLPILACPLCRGTLTFRGEASAERVVQGELLCCACGRTYAVRDEMPILKDRDQSAGEWQWQVDTRAPEDFERLRAAYDAALPVAVRQSRAKLVEHLLRVAEDPDGPILDVGTGMGTLFRPLAARLETRRSGDQAPACLACDVDERVLRGTQLRLRREGHDANASFCVSDAKYLAVQDGAMAAVVSLDGFANIPDGWAALREAARVLRPGGVLAFSTLLLDEASPSFQLAAELGHSELMSTDGVLAGLSAAGLQPCEQRQFASGTWPACLYDLLPREGDRFAHAVFSAHKPEGSDG